VTATKNRQELLQEAFGLIAEAFALTKEMDEADGSETHRWTVSQPHGDLRIEVSVTPKHRLPPEERW
jgi:hypothetical protein